MNHRYFVETVKEHGGSQGFMLDDIDSAIYMAMMAGFALGGFDTMLTIEKLCKQFKQCDAYQMVSHESSRKQWTVRLRRM